MKLISNFKDTYDKDIWYSDEPVFWRRKQTKRSLLKLPTHETQKIQAALKQTPLRLPETNGPKSFRIELDNKLIYAVCGTIYFGLNIFIRKSRGDIVGENIYVWHPKKITQILKEKFPKETKAIKHFTTNKKNGYFTEPNWKTTHTIKAPIEIFQQADSPLVELSFHKEKIFYRQNPALGSTFPLGSNFINKLEHFMTNEMETKEPPQLITPDDAHAATKEINKRPFRRQPRTK